MNIREEAYPESKRKIHIIKNANPSSVSCRKGWHRAEKLLKKNSIPYTVHETKYPGHASVITKELLKSGEDRAFMVAVGGDGTVQEVINGIGSRPDVLFAALPAGSGNDFVRGVQKSVCMKEAVDLLHKEENPYFIDLGKCFVDGKKHFFVNSIGMGFDAFITQAVNQSKWKPWLQKWKLGKFIYLYYLLKLIFRFERFQVEANIDGEKLTFKHVWLAVAANQPYFGGGMKISPESLPDNGKLDVIIVHEASPLTFLAVLLSVFWGGHIRLKWVKTFSCSSVQITADREMPVQADGEKAGATFLKASILPSVLRIQGVEGENGHELS